MRTEKVNDLEVIVSENELEKIILSKLGFYTFKSMNIETNYGIKLEDAKMVFLYENGEIGVMFKDLMEFNYKNN